MKIGICVNYKITNTFRARLKQIYSPRVSIEFFPLADKNWYQINYDIYSVSNIRRFSCEKIVLSKLAVISFFMLRILIV